MTDKKYKSLFKRLEKFECKAKGHRQRVRERFLQDGPKSFSDEDLLELLLFFGIPRKDTRGIARELLKKYDGRLDKVLSAPLEELCEVKNLGPKALLPIKVVHEIARRYLKARTLDVRYLRSPKEVYEYLIYELKGEKEKFLWLFIFPQI